MVKNPSLELLRQIGTPFDPRQRYAAPAESTGLFEHAFKNRIGLLYLKNLKDSGCLEDLDPEYEKLAFREAQTKLTAARAGRVLDDLKVDYVLFKTMRPFPATPNDVDIVCLGDRRDYERAARAFFGLGYRNLAGPAPMQTLFVDPRGFNGNGERVDAHKKGGIYYVDLYRAPSADYFVYIDPGKLRQEAVRMNIDAADGYQASVLRPEIELASILMHSVFPEKTFTLELFYTICHWLNGFGARQKERFVRFSLENHIRFPVRACFTLAVVLHREAFGFVPGELEQVIGELGGMYGPEASSFSSGGMNGPYHFLASSFCLAFLRKLPDPASQRSLAVQGLHMMDPRFAAGVFKSLWRHMTTGSYHQV